MKEASKKLYQKLPKNKVRCLACQRKCLIAPDKTGFCKTRVNKKGKLYTTIYGIVSSVNNDPIEKKPVFHFQPGSNALSLGTFGCNFKCKFCFHPQTKVVTNKGVLPLETIFGLSSSKISLEDGEIGNPENLFVVTHRGKERRVTKVFRHFYKGQLIKIKPYFSPEILVTPGHEFFTLVSPSGKTTKTKAKDLTKNHLLLIPRSCSFSQDITLDLLSVLNNYQGKYLKSRKTSWEDILKIIKMFQQGFTSREIGQISNLHPTYLRKLKSQFKNGKIDEHFISWGKNVGVEKDDQVKFKTEKKPGIPRYIKLDKSLAKLLGYYCAEGWVSSFKNRPNSLKLNFSFSKKEKEYTEETAELIKKIFGIIPTLRQRKTTLTVELGKSSIGYLFQTLCGKGAKNKKVPEIINLAKKEIVSAFLKGYVNGDGWKTEKEIAINTVSERLAFGIYWLVLKLGFLPRFYVWKPSVKKQFGKRTINQSPLFYVKWKLYQQKKQPWTRFSKKFFQTKKFFLVPIDKISNQKYEGPVYNMEVEKEHSYLANFVAVGNCQNWEISWADGVAEAKYGKKISPQKAIDLAQKNDSAGIAITYNEPTIWVEYSLDVFKLAKKENLYTCWVTNGYATQKSIDLIAPYLDIYRVDLKSFENRFYQKLIGIPKAAPIFEMTKYVHDQYPEIHIECITNIIPTWNDLEKGLKQIANWIVKYLGKKTPWHVTRFFPYAELTDVPPTPPETLFKAREIGLKAGLKFVYIGNLAVDQEDDTFCPKCGNLTIRRTGYSVEVLGVNKNGQCSDCEEDLNVKTI